MKMFIDCGLRSYEVALKEEEVEIMEGENND